MSETLLAFATRAATLGNAQQVERQLNFAALVWNIVVEQANNWERIVQVLDETIVARLNEPPAEIRNACLALARRKLDNFAEDPRTIVGVQVSWDDKGFKVHASSATLPT
jgi:hypothetical protein